MTQTIKPHHFQLTAQTKTEPRPTSHRAKSHVASRKTRGQHTNTVRQKFTLFHAISRFSVNVSKNKKTIRQLFTPNHAKSRFPVCTSLKDRNTIREEVAQKQTKFVGSFTPNRLQVCAGVKNMVGTYFGQPGGINGPLLNCFWGATFNKNRYLLGL